MKQISKSLEETEVLATKFLRKLQLLADEEKATTLLLKGDLGAGKTAFTKLLAKHLGVKDEVTSPTFVIMKKYQTWNPFFESLVHVDAYRIEDQKELEVIKFKEVFEKPKALVVIEWPEKIGKTPEDAFVVDFSFLDDTTREIVFPFEI